MGFVIPYTLQEDSFLRENYLNLSIDEMVKNLNRTKSGLYTRLNKLGLDTRKWLDEEINILMNNYNIDVDYLLKLLPRRSINAIRSKSKELGIVFRVNNRALLNDKQLEDFRIKFPILMNKEIMNIFNLKESQITYLANKFGVKKLDEYKKKRNIHYVMKKPKEDTYFIDYYFKKYGIVIKNNNLESIDIIQWYKYLFETPNGNKMQFLPRFIYADINNIIKIWKYVFEEVLQIKTRNGLLEFTSEQLILYKIFFKKYKQYNKYYKYIEILTILYPEYNIKEWELKFLPSGFFKSDELILEGLEWLLNKYNYKLEDILNNKIIKNILFKEKFSTIWNKFHNIHDMFIWFYKKKYNIDITYTDFKIKPKQYMYNKNNADYELKKFIDLLFSEGILDNNNFKFELQNIFNQEHLLEIGQYQLITAVLYHFKTTIFYKWFNELYPEWKLKSEDFKISMTFDNKKADSREEAKVYNFIKNNYNVDLNIIGRNKKRKMYNEKENEYYIPDFYISKYNNINLSKILYIEYFGMFRDNPHNEIFVDYKNKTYRKEEFYRSKDDIYFISLYPEDLKNNFAGLKQKFESFFITNFNIELPLIKTE